MSALTQRWSRPGRPPTQLRHGALNALRVLETCPLVPVDVFVHLAGLTSPSSAYEQLARLRRAGLADVRRVDPGYLIAERRLGCWTITQDGRRVLGLDGSQAPGEQVVPQAGTGTRGQNGRRRIRDSDLPLLIATYRLLASLVVERCALEPRCAVIAWEWPWVREARSVAEGGLLRVKMPAGAVLGAHGHVVDPDGVRGRLARLLLVPDLGTAPVVHYRERLRRLFALAQSPECDPELELVIATPDSDGIAGRSAAWRELLDRIGCRVGGDSLPVRVLTWERVAAMLTPARPMERGADGGFPGRAGRWEPLGILRVSTPARGRDRLLHLKRFAQYPAPGVP